MAQKIKLTKKIKPYLDNEGRALPYPLSRNPMRLAGTWKQYSNKAKNQLNKMTPNSGKWSNQLNCWRIFKWPYQAHVIKMLDTINNKIA